MLWRHATLRPGQDAVTDSRATLDYWHLGTLVGDFAMELLDQGVRPGEPVVVLFDVCVESVIAYWALRAVDAVIVVGDPTGKQADVDHYLQVTGARRVLAGTRAAASLRPPQGVAWHVLEDVTGAAPRRWRRDASSGHPAAAVRHEPARAVILFSSGTTGKPKAIVHTKDSIRSLHEVLKLTWKLSPADRVLGALPFHTIYGLIFSAASVLHAGATLVLLERFRPGDALAAIERQRVTTAAFVPAMALMILGYDGRDGYDLSTLRAIYTASAPIAESDIARFSVFCGAPIVANYGMTEIPGAAVEPADEAHRPGSVGRISPGFEVCVRGKGGEPVPDGETGEITMRGPSMMIGYLDPAQTADRVRDGWIYSQDIGRVDADGHIYLSGRLSDMIIRGGLNISPREIENALSAHPDVLDAAVVGTPDTVLGQVVTAFVAVRRPADADRLRASLAEHCRGILAPAKVPASIVFMEELPRNAGGKVLRKQLLEMAPAPSDRVAGPDRKGNPA